MKKEVTLITIDGPAASGKTTVARLLAKRLDYKLLESGALYRTVTYFIIRERVYERIVSRDLDISSFLKDFFKKVEITLDTEGTRIFLEKRIVNKELRLKEVEERVSFVAALPEVRAFLNDYMRNLVNGMHVVAEGRDMGSEVFKEAKLKIFLTADERIRVQRRYKERQDLRVSSYEETLRNIELRDKLDSKREVAPLKIPEDAYVIDTSLLTPEEVVEKILEKIKAL